MELCSVRHDGICYESGRCPVCDLKDEIADLEQQVKDLEQQVEELTNME